MAKDPEHRYVNVQTRTMDVLVRRFGRLPPSPHSLWFVLLTGEDTTRLPGVLRTGRGALSEALDWTIEEFDECWKPLEAEGMVAADWKARMIYLPKAFKQGPNRPNSVNSAVTWRREFNDLPDCKLTRQIDRDIRSMLTEMGPGFFVSYDTCKRVDQPKSKPGAANSGADSALPKTGAKDEAKALANALAKAEPNAGHGSSQSGGQSPRQDLHSGSISGSALEKNSLPGAGVKAPEPELSGGDLERIWYEVVRKTPTGNRPELERTRLLVGDSASRRGVAAAGLFRDLCKAFLLMLDEWFQRGRETNKTVEKFNEHFTLIDDRVGEARSVARRKTDEEPYEPLFPDLAVPNS